VRLVAYEDAVYRRRRGIITVHRAFPTFMAGIAEEVDHVVVAGRLDSRPGASHYELPPGVEFRALPHYSSLLDAGEVLRALWGTIRAFWRILDEVDSAWINGPSPMALVFAAIALLRRRSLFLGVRQNTLEYARRRHPRRPLVLVAFWAMELLWRTLARRTAVVAVGPELAGVYAGCRNRFELTVSMVSERDLVPGPEAHAGRDWSGELRLLSVGRLESEKNPLLLADILARLDGRWRLVVCGEGELRDVLTQRLVELGLAERCELLGYVPLDRGLLDLYRSSHAFLHVSWTEGLPQVLYEAFAARMPVVATAVGGVAQAAGGAAILIPPADADAAAAAVERLAADPALRARLVEAGAERVRDHTIEAERRRLAAWMRQVARQ